MTLNRWGIHHNHRRRRSNPMGHLHSQKEEYYCRFEAIKLVSIGILAIICDDQLGGVVKSPRLELIENN